MNEFIKTHFVFFLIASMLLGFFVPGPFAIFANLVVPILACIMISSFLSIDFAVLKKRLSRPKDIIIVFVIVKIIIPAGLYFIIKPFDPVIALAILLISAAPAAAVSPTFTKLCRGDMEFALVVLMITSVLSPITLPLTINLLAGTNIDIDIWGMVKTLLQIIVIPFVATLVLKRFCSKSIEKVKPYLGSFAVIALAILLLGLVANGAADIKSNYALFPKFTLVSCLLGIYLALAGWFFFLFFNREKRIALSLSTSYINVGLIIVLSSRFFPIEVMIFTLIYEIPANILPGIIKWLCNKKSNQVL